MRCSQLALPGVISPPGRCLSLTHSLLQPLPKPLPSSAPASSPHPLQILICGGTTFLFVRQAACAAANLTTNELLLRHKYGYLQAPADRTFTNPFDEGPANNCVQVRRAAVGSGGSKDAGQMVQEKSKSCIAPPGAACLPACLLRADRVAHSELVDASSRT